MRILYVAPDQRVPGTDGGSAHVAGVAAGLAALGHDVHVAAAPGRGPFPAGAAWTALAPPFGRRRLRWLRAGRVRALARRFRPDVVIERYYNFGGEGMLAARAVGALAVLEVNAPVVDHPGSGKRRLDRALVVEPLRRWREWQCRQADLIVTPHPGMLPPETPAARVAALEWGADTARFAPGAAGAVPFRRRAGETCVVFAGAFRVWHGAAHLVAAVRRLREHGRRDVAAVLIGDGPEWPRVRAAAREVDGVACIGAVPHAQMPACLAAADVGAAPFDVAAHPPLRLGFYWSPIKLFEYMAAGLPVAAPRIDRVAALVRDGQDGVLYDAADHPAGLARAIAALCDPVRRARLGANARARAVERFGWDVHCRQLEAAMQAALARRRQT